jgi:hypothetical protein
MLKLLQYLRANGFKTYIVTGGGQEFVRAFVEQVYLNQAGTLCLRLRHFLHFRVGQPCSADSSLVFFFALPVSSHGYACHCGV